MKVVGVLLIGLLSGVLAAAVSLASGGTIWTALLNYVGFGMVASLAGVIVVIWRAFEGERSATALALGGATPTAE